VQKDAWRQAECAFLYLLFPESAPPHSPSSLDQAGHAQSFALFASGDAVEGLNNINTKKHLISFPGFGCSSETIRHLIDLLASPKGAVSP
jgi:hypothetical protein